MVYPKLTLDDIPTLFSDTIYQRGRNYYAIGAVHKIMSRDDLLLAEVEGSEDEYYKVVIQFKKNQVSTANCSCPYGKSFVGYCKHIAATLLTYVDKPEDVIYAESVATILEPLSEKQLRGALEHLLTLYPEAIDRLELYLKKSKTLGTVSKQKNQKQAKSTLTEVKIDTKIYEKMLHNAIRATNLDWDGFPDYDNIDPIFEEIYPFLEKGAYAEALILTSNLIDEFIDTVNNSEEINYSDNIGFADESIFVEFDKCLVEAIYGTELNDSDRKPLVHKILQWHDDITNDWTSPDLNMSAHALISGFENIDAEAEELIQEVTRYDFDESDRHLSEQIKLRVIQQSGDLDTALDFAKKQGHDADYLIILSEQGKLEHLMDEYKIHIHQDADALKVIEHLVDDYPAEALEISSYALAQVPTERSPFLIRDNLNDATNKLPYAPKRRELATFCKDLAKTIGDKSVQLDASIIEFQYEPNLTRYLELEILAANNWKHLKNSLLKGLYDQYFGYFRPEAAVDIFIHEKLFDNAIAMATKTQGFSTEKLLRKIMPVVTKTHADWVTTQAEKKAEEIIEAGKAKYYYEAVRWLEHSKAAYLAHNQKTEWEAYLLGIRTKHGKKRKLMGLIKDL